MAYHAALKTILVDDGCSRICKPTCSPCTATAVNGSGHACTGERSSVEECHHAHASSEHNAHFAAVWPADCVMRECMHAMLGAAHRFSNSGSKRHDQSRSCATLASSTASRAALHVACAARHYSCKVQSVSEFSEVCKRHEVLAIGYAPSADGRRAVGICLRQIAIP